MKIVNQNLGWCRLPYELLQDENLSVVDAAVYSILLDYCVDELKCTCSISNISSASGISERTIKRSIAQLERYEYISHVRTGKESDYILADIIGLKRERRRATLKKAEVAPEQPEQGQQEMQLRYGEYQNVALTMAQFDSLMHDFGERKTLEYIKRCDEYCQQTGKHYADYALTIRKWIAGDKDKPGADGMTDKQREKMAAYMSVVNQFPNEGVK